MGIPVDFDTKIGVLGKGRKVTEARTTLSSS
jgi:hypothetical protein